MVLVGEDRGRHVHIPARVVIETHEDGSRSVLVPWWWAWALSKHGPVGLS